MKVEHTIPCHNLKVRTYERYDHYLVVADEGHTEVTLNSIFFQNENMFILIIFTKSFEYL